MAFFTLPSSWCWQVWLMVAVQIGTTLLMSVPQTAAASCDPPAYQECFHLQSDVEGMARAGDTRYMGRHFGNLDFQCTTAADVEDAKAMIRGCASRGEWTSRIPVGEAQELLDRVIRPYVATTSMPMTQMPASDELARDGLSGEDSAFEEESEYQTRAAEIEPLDAEHQQQNAAIDAGNAIPPAPISQAAVTHPVVDASAVQEPQASPAAAAIPSAEHMPASQPAPVRASRVQDVGPAAESKSVFPWFWVYIALWLAVVLVGIIAGWKEKIVVFRNYDDLAMMFFMMVVPLGIAFTGFIVGDKSHPYAVPSLILAAIILSGFLVWASIRTWHDQVPHSVGAFALALITKMSLGILFVNALLTVIAPGGKSQLARARARSSALVWLAVLTPVVMRLVRDHEGIWSPRNVLSPHQRRRAGM